VSATLEYLLHVPTKHDATYRLIRHISKRLRSQFLRRKDISSLTLGNVPERGLNLLGPIFCNPVNLIVTQRDFEG